LRAPGLKGHIYRTSKRSELLSEQGKGSNRTKSVVRARVERI
jgi:transposase, IS5 family